MGLDMFLFRRQRSSSAPLFSNDPAVEDVGYWRKANAIHRWFVDHVQHGIDNCAPYPVTAEDLQILLDTVEDVLAHQGDTDYADQHLPTQGGFFFGSTEYDADYWSDLEDTREILRRVLDTTNFSEQEIFYQSSW